MSKPKLAFVAIQCASLLLLAGCGGDQSQDTGTLSATADPVTVSLQLSGTEDTIIHGNLASSSPAAGGTEYNFRIVRQPRHGQVTVNSDNGDFDYLPATDWFGTDTFTWRSDRNRSATPTRAAEISITPVNDAPVFAEIPDEQNSAETHDSVLALQITDPDGDSLHITAVSADLNVAVVSANDTDRTLTISPGQRGTSRIHVTVADGEFTVEREFGFTVGDVTKQRTVAASSLDGEAITFTNTTDQDVTLTFTHNGFPLFQSEDEIVEYVRNLAPDYMGEPFERKLWRFVRDNAYHNIPINTRKWFHDAWAVITSQGWGFCSHVSAAYVQLARRAGYEARVWGLTGHVVPEIKIDGRWEMFDPDLALYYFTPDLKLAGVGELAADPSLISSPVNPVLPLNGTVEYSLELATYYGTTADNYIGEDEFLTDTPAVYQPLVLPPGARLTYPGKWTSELLGDDGTSQREIPYFLQSQLLTKAGWTGHLTLPWMLWEIRGTGRVRVLGQDFDIGSPALTTLLHDPGRQIPDVEVLTADSDLRFVSFINAMRYGLNTSNQVSVTGKDVWAIEIAKRLLADEVWPNPNGGTQFRKPSF